MPYENEYAHKTSHVDFVKNPDVLAFLDNCEYLKPPSDEEAQQMAAFFQPAPRDHSRPLPELALAIDGSPYESSRDDRLPSTKVGYLKVGAILFSLQSFSTLRQGRFVDPFRVSSLQDDNTTLAFILHSANVLLRGKANVRDSFRAALDAQFISKATRFDDKNHHTSLRSTLFHLAWRRPGDLEAADPFHLKLHGCPTCGKGPVQVEDKEGAQFCPFCGAEVYPTDCLRIWEEVNDFQSNYTALSRLMSVLEHLLPIHYIRFVADRALFALTRVAFFLDGPLALFGTSAWLHRNILIYINEINARLLRQHQPPLLIIGLQKTGQVVDHVNMIERFLPTDRLFCIDDDYRNAVVPIALAHRFAAISLQPGGRVLDLLTRRSLL